MLYSSNTTGHDEYTVSIETFGPTTSFSIDDRGNCVSARISEDGIDVPIDTSLFRLLVIT